MKVQCNWQEKLIFEAVVDGHSVLMDAKSPIGTDRAPSPKSMVLVAICGCTAMDVMALLKKHKQSTSKFSILASADVGKTNPMVFTSVELIYNLEGEISKDVANEAVRLSQTKYCGVSAMIAKVCPISYVVNLNGETIGQGKADFNS